MNHPTQMPPSQPRRPHQPLLPVELSLSPEFADLLTRFVTILESPPMKEQELVDLIKGATAQLTSLMDAEHAEVLAALESLKNGEIPQAVTDAVQGFIDAAKGGIPKILDAVTTPPDGGTVTPVPAPAPAPADGGTPPTPPTP
jgi:hypothetical protein